MTPLTLAAATARDYTVQHIVHHIESAQQAPLAASHIAQLYQWQAHASGTKLRRVTLLSTDTPGQMSAIHQRRRLSNHIHEQIGTRHAIVAPQIARPLRHYLAQNDQLLDYVAPRNTTMSPSIAAAAGTTETWLALRVLAGLSAQLPLSVPDLRLALDSAATAIAPEELTALQAQAEKILDAISRAIAGKDAFFPALTPLCDHVLATLTTAIADETTLHIAYQGLGETEPRWREIEPLRLAQHGTLYYLQAYCHLAQAQRTFRLDRIHEIRIEPDNIARTHETAPLPPLTHHTSTSDRLALNGKSAETTHRLALDYEHNA
jgi:hypothetical protein